MSDDRDQSDDPRIEVYRLPPGVPLQFDDEQDTMSVVGFVNVLLRHRWKVFGLPVALAVLVVAGTVLWPDRYTSEASISPQSGGGVSGQLSQLSGLASQFGVDVPEVQSGQSPEFYADLLMSRRLLEEAVTTRYYPRASAESAGRQEGAPGVSARGDSAPGRVVAATDTAGVTLIELYGIDEPTPGLAVVEAAKKLEDAVSASAVPETGVVELSVTTPWPEVSQQVADRLIELVNRFNNRVRQTQAAAEAQFVRGRLEQARSELRAAEDSLENFMQRNVSWQQSPALRFEYDRLQRQVSLKQQLYTSLATRYEEARISEVKETPVVTTVTRPKASVRPDSGHLPLRALLSLMAGGLIGVFWAFGAEAAEDLREENSEDYRRFVSLKREAAGDLRRAGRRIRRLVGGGSSGSVE